MYRRTIVVFSYITLWQYSDCDLR